VVCPHCRQTVSVDYEHIKSHYASELGKRSIQKDAHYKEKLRHARTQRWKNYVHPKQDALLELSRHEDLTKLNLVQIAQRLGITRSRSQTVKKIITRLQRDGLLSADIGRGHGKLTRSLIELSKREDLSLLNLVQIADKLGIKGRYRSQAAGSLVKKLQRKGVLDPAAGKGRSRVSRQLLELSTTVDIFSLSHREIADRLNIYGKWRTHTVWSNLRKLEKKGILKRSV
jgi:DNA-binding PadR family transcriptional regulator